MRIGYYHASRFGNGAMVAEEFRRQANALGATVEVHHMREMNPRELPPADLYVFSSPGQWGKPIKRTRRFLSQLALPPGTRCAILTTEMEPKPEKTTGLIPSEEEQAKWQRVRPIMNDLLQAAGVEKVVEDVIHVTEIKGPLEEGWESEVEDFVHLIVSARQAQKQ